MKDRIAAFLDDLDRSLAADAGGEQLNIFHIGRSALVWNYDYTATTKDFDDLAATKLRRFWAKDREDIRLLCDRDLLDPERLETVLEKAFLWNLPKDGDSFRDTAFEHLRTVQQYLRGEIEEF